MGSRECAQGGVGSREDILGMYKLYTDNLFVGWELYLCEFLTFSTIPDEIAETYNIYIYYKIYIK